MSKISRFQRFKERMLGERGIVPKSRAEQFMGLSAGKLDALWDELWSTIGFREPLPFVMVFLECPPGLQTEAENARVNLSTGPVWVYAHRDRNTFLSFLDDGSEDAMDEAVANGANVIVAVVRNDKFALMPVRMAPYPLTAVVEQAGAA